MRHTDQSQIRPVELSSGEMVAPLAWDNVYPRKVAERLISGLKETPSGCFEWQRGKNAKGYGWIFVEGKCQYTHRTMLEIKLRRKLEPGEIVLHSCDNPPCCNPEHLIVGDLYANIADAVGKGRHNTRIRSKRPQLTCEQVVQIRLALRSGHGIFAIAMRFNRGEQTIRDIRSWKTWKNVTLDAILPTWPNS